MKKNNFFEQFSFRIDFFMADFICPRAICICFMGEFFANGEPSHVATFDMG